MHKFESDRAGPLAPDGAAARQEQGKRRRSYQAPVIEVFGDIRSITLALGMNGVRDNGGMMGMNRTRL